MKKRMDEHNGFRFLSQTFKMEREMTIKSYNLIVIFY
jgi:hypothetical protein